MANTLYNIGRQLFLEAQINWKSDTIMCALVDTSPGTGYTFSPAHGYWSVIAGLGTGAYPGVPKRLVRLVGGPDLDTTDGAADADDVTFVAVPSSANAIEAIIIFKDTGVAGTSPLIAYIDTATGLPITPNGGDIIVTWDNGVNKIFRL